MGRAVARTRAPSQVQIRPRVDLLVSLARSCSRCGRRDLAPATHERITSPTPCGAHQSTVEPAGTRTRPHPGPTATAHMQGRGDTAPEAGRHRFSSPSDQWAGSNACDRLDRFQFGDGAQPVIRCARRRRVPRRDSGRSSGSARPPQRYAARPARTLQVTGHATCFDVRMREEALSAAGAVDLAPKKKQSPALDRGNWCRVSSNRCNGCSR